MKHPQEWLGRCVYEDRELIFSIGSQQLEEEAQKDQTVQSTHTQLDESSDALQNLLIEVWEFPRNGLTGNESGAASVGNLTHGISFLQPERTTADRKGITIFPYDHIDRWSLI